MRALRAWVLAGFNMFWDLDFQHSGFGIQGLGVQAASGFKCYRAQACRLRIVG